MQSGQNHCEIIAYFHLHMNKLQELKVESFDFMD